MRFQVTVRYGRRYQRYHTFEVDAPEMGKALSLAASALPEEVAAEADLVELRRAVSDEERTYLGEEEEP